LETFALLAAGAALIAAAGFWCGRRAALRSPPVPSADEGLFRTLFDHSIDAAYVIAIGPDGRPSFETWNPVASRAIGYSPEEGRGKHFADLLSPAIAEQAHTETMHVVATGQPLRLERPINTDGRDRFLDFAHVPLVGPSGRVERVFTSIRDVTYLKEVEAALREKSALLEVALSHMDLGLLTIGSDGHIGVSNARAAELLNLDPAFLAARPHYMDVRRRQIAQGDLTPAPEVQTWAASGELMPAKATYERQRPDGMVLEVKSLALPDGGVVRTYNDITQRKLAEASIAESEARYRLLAENTGDVIVLAPVEGRSRYVSGAIKNLLGYTPEEALASSLDAFTHPDDLALVHQAFRSVRVDGPLAAIEHRFRHKDSSEVWVEARLRAIQAPGDEVMVISSIRDITKRRRAEQRLQEQSARFDIVLDAMIQGLCLFDRNLRLVVCNRRYAEMFGLPEHLTRPGTLLKTILEYRVAMGLYAGDPEAFIAERLRVARAGRQAQQDLQMVDGRMLALMHTPLQEGGWLATYEDITERREQADRLKAAQAEAEAARIAAEAASEAKSEFLASMSHEIRTPLNGILGYTDILLGDPALTPDQGRGLQRIQSAGQALLTVVNDILDFSRIESGLIEIEQHPFSPGALLDNAVSIVRSISDGKGLFLTLVLDPRLPEVVVGDEDRLRQVLLNLLNNAVKFTPQGGVTLTAEVVGQGAGTCRLRLSVADTGIGIPPDRLDRLFQRFSQVDSSIRREFGGTGLGLAISKRLVELMGGTIGVESRPGQGSTFWLSLEVRVVEERRRGDRRKGAAPRAVAAGARLLLAEDNEINQEIARTVLEGAGHRVDVVADGAAALMAVEAGGYDLVLMDVQMPVMDGITATARIRALEGEGRQVPIIAMTANVLPQQVAAFQAAGMDDHVGKPFRREELLAAVERWRGKRSSQPVAPAITAA
jgi:PAS domain S-box-containing protein